MEVVIIRLTPYREKDYIVNALSNDGIITFRAPGALGLKSKFAGKLFLYALVEIELRDTKAGQTLSYIESLNNAAKIFSHYDKVIALNFIGEIIQKTLKDDDSVKETFTLLKNTLIALSTTTHNLSLVYVFLTNLLRLLGLGLVIDRCVYSGTKQNIVGVDLSAGGLVAKGYVKENAILLNAEEVKILRYGFLINETELLRHEFSDTDVRRLLQIMVVYLETTYNFKILSNELIK